MAQGRTTWSKLIAKHGHLCDMIRPGVATVTVKMIRQHSTEVPQVHEASQATVRFTVEHLTLENAGFPLPPEKLDRVKSLDKYYTISNVETQQAFGEIVGYRLDATG